MFALKMKRCVFFFVVMVLKDGEKNLIKLALSRALSSRSFTTEVGFSLSDGLMVLVISIDWADGLFIHL